MKTVNQNPLSKPCGKMSSAENPLAEQENLHFSVLQNPLSKHVPLSSS